MNLTLQLTILSPKVLVLYRTCIPDHILTKHTIPLPISNPPLQPPACQSVSVE